jgi:hypothetical protein
MNPKAFKLAVALVGVIFTTLFCAVVIPPFIAHPDIVAAFAAGFVNPFASGYSIDVLCCYLLLVLWIVYERSNVKYGWICLVIGVVPGVAAGFALYLLLRTYQLQPQRP